MANIHIFVLLQIVYDIDINIAYILIILLFGFTRISSDFTSEIIIKSTKMYFFWFLREILYEIITQIDHITTIFIFGFVRIYFRVSSLYGEHLLKMTLASLKQY